ncbi:hypothetical protein [Pedobacter immunditicola]|uniref:hypothetical protein n=1 Tax=Pedobacter immunditicola TaxID=3133440 RepID=UPI0030A9BEEF
MENIALKTLRDKCILYNQFMIDSGAIPRELMGTYLAANKYIEAAYQEGKMKPLKAISIDIDDQVIRHMPLSMANKLKGLFKEKLHIDYEAVDKARLKAIQKILKKGKISTGEEYELAFNRVDEIYAERDKADEVKQLNELLTAFDKN